MKARLRSTLPCSLLILCLLLGTLIFPIHATDTPEQEIALTLAQAESAQPGQNVTLTLSLPATAIAGGFMTLTYDASLFTLKDISLLQGTDALTLTYHDKGGSINILLDSAHNVQIDGAFLSLTFASSEEIQPGTYPFTCTVPDAASFYALKEDGSTTPLQIGGCQGAVIVTDPPLPPCPARYLACQETNPYDGIILVRLCALVELGATLSRGSYGFVLSLSDANGTQEITLAGSEITDQIEGGGRTYTAQELGGNVFTAALSVPATGEVSITLTPYVRLDGQSLYGGTYTLLYQNGTYVGTSGGI